MEELYVILSNILSIYALVLDEWILYNDFHKSSPTGNPNGHLQYETEGKDENNSTIFPLR